MTLLAAAGCGDEAPMGGGETVADAGGDDAFDGALEIDGDEADTVTDAAFNGDVYGEPQTSPDAALESAWVRVVHAAPDLGMATLYLNEDSNALGTLEYTRVTDWVAIDPGNHVLSVVQGEAVVADTGEMTVPAGTRVTAVIAPVPGGEVGVRFVLLSEDYPAVPTGRAVLRLVHASPDTPTVDVTIDSGKEAWSVVRPYEGSSAQSVRVREGEPTRLTLQSSGDVVDVFGTFTLPVIEPEAELLLVLAGRSERLARAADGLVLLAIEASGAVTAIRRDPQLHLLNAAGVAAIDVLSEGQPLAEGLEFGELAEVAELAPGAHRLDLFVADLERADDGAAFRDGSPAVTVETTELMAGETYLAVATGDPGASDAQGSLQVLLWREGFDIDTDSSLLRVLHAAASQGMLDLTLEAEELTDRPQPARLEFAQGTPTAGLDLPEGLLWLDISAEGLPTQPVELDLTAGMRALVVISDPQPQPVAVVGARPLAVFLIQAGQMSWSIDDL